MHNIPIGMKRKKHIRENTGKKRTEVFLGILMIFSAVFFCVALFFFSPKESTIFTASELRPDPLSRYIISSVCDVLIQIFGIMIYFIIPLLLIWGINFISGKIHSIKHKSLLAVSFVIIGCVISNVFFSNYAKPEILEKLKIVYFPGGVLGYFFSKLLFLSVIRNAAFFKYSFFGLSLIWLFILKKTYFISFYSTRQYSAQLFKNFKISMPQKKSEPSPVWEESPSEPAEQEDPVHQNDEPKAEPVEDFSGLIAGGGDYAIPNVDLLDKINQQELSQDEKKLNQQAVELCRVLEEFGIKGEVLNIRQGPVVTMFEFRPAPGIKTSRVISLSDDIARSMSAISARISTIPGQNAIGIELPNKNRHTVFLRELLSSEAFRNFSVGIPLALGKDISGNPIMADLAKMPHLLVAGTTGSGKSVSINGMILSILFRFSPKECKLIMIDPKMLELSVYDEIPHLLTPVVTDPKKAVFALKWAVAEMETRYRQMSKLGVRNIDGFNKKIKDSKKNGELLVRKVQTGFDQETGRPIFETQQLDFEPMPYIVVIVDEMADLMLVAGKDVEAAIQRLAQMARAAGIHLIMATQRPSVDVITGTIKANFPTRISFQVTSKIDSRTILGEQGAEQLLGQGDMLYMSGAGRILRVHGPFVKDNEVERIVAYIKGQGEPDYVDVTVNQMLDSSESEASSGDEMYQKALDIVLNDKKVSISYIQRKLQIGYNRAARIVEEMEEKGVVSPPNHTGKREILI